MHGSHTERRPLPHRPGQGRQRGLSVLGLVLTLAVAGFLGVLALKVVPTVVEYRAINTAIGLAKQAGGTPREVQLAFDRNASASYIDSIRGRDLTIEKGEAGLEVSFAYEKKIPLFGPASLVLDYAGSTAPGGVAPASAP